MRKNSYETGFRKTIPLEISALVKISPIGAIPSPNGVFFRAKNPKKIITDVDENTKRAVARLFGQVFEV